MNNFDQDAINQKLILMVRGLHSTLASESVLESHFIPFGPIIKIVMPKPDKKEGTEKDDKEEQSNTLPILNKGYAFIQFEYADDAQAAMYNMDNNELFERTLKCSFAQSNQTALASTAQPSGQ